MQAFQNSSMTFSSVYYAGYSTRFIQDGSYLRIKDVTLSYTLPQHIKDELSLDADINTEINTDVPIKVKQPESSICITQTGANSVSQIINSGGISVINF